MKPLKLTLLLSVLVFAFSLNSCKKEEKGTPVIMGCTDSNAENYDPDATESDGSCVYPADKFVGTYSMSEDWSSQKCGGGTETYSITIAKVSYNRIKILNFGNVLSSPVYADVTGSSFSISYQDFLISKSSEFWDVLGGNGSLSGNTLSLDYWVTDAQFDNVCGKITGDSSGSK